MTPEDAMRRAYEPPHDIEPDPDGSMAVVAALVGVVGTLVLALALGMLML